MLMPAGLVACFFPLTDATLFLILYGMTAVYFSGVMVGQPAYSAAFLCLLAIPTEFSRSFRWAQFSSLLPLAQQQLCALAVIFCL